MFFTDPPEDTRVELVESIAAAVTFALGTITTTTGGPTTQPLFLPWPSQRGHGAVRV